MPMWILDGREPVRCPDLDAWAAWQMTHDACLARTELPGGVLVSTAFIGCGLAIFETMVFRQGKAAGQWRWDTWDEAMEGHEFIVDSVSKAPPAPGSGLVK